MFNTCTNGTPSNRSPVYFDDTYSEINVTAILRSWAAYNAGDTTAANPAYGLVLVDETESNPGYYKKVYTVENAGADMFFTFDYSDAPGGEYYLANVGAGGMLQRSGSAVTVGTYVSDATTTWLIEYVGNGYHVIRSSADQTKLLSSGPALNTVSGSSIPTASKWVLSMGVGVGGYIFKNASTNTVLYSANGTSLSLISAPGTTSSSYANTAWYTFEAEETVWPTSVSYNGETFFTTGTVTSLMLTPTPANADYCSPQYFTWTSDQDNFDFSGATLSIEAPGGIATITATHKYTGATDTFDIQGGALPEGIYWFQNAETGRFMEANTSSNAVYQQDVHDGIQNMWVLFLLEDGRYWIQSNCNYLYMSVKDSATDVNANIICSSTTSMDQTKWYITKNNENGAYRITPSHPDASELALGVPSSADNNGTQLKQITYTSDGTNHDHWYAYSQLYSIVNYYDSSFASNPDLLGHIPETNDFAGQIYREFGVYFFMDGPAIQKQEVFSIQDHENAIVCPYGTNHPCTEEVCGVNEDCYASHHKSARRISDYLFLDQPREDNHIYILWTDLGYNKYCGWEAKKDDFGEYILDENGDYVYEHRFENFIACVYGHRPVVLFTDILGSNVNEQKACMSITLIHELAHTFGMSDVYGDGHDVEDEYVCVMEYFEEDASTTYYATLKGNREENDEVVPFCTSCKNTLTSMILGCFHAGNQV